jgi:hypothetical protein
MHGRGLFIPYAVRTQDLELPDHLEPQAVLGVTMGVLAFIEYTPPSPLTYRELIWMPSWVRAKGGRGGDRGRKLALYVARMYVDDPNTLEAGRVIWRLPKTFADFEEQDGQVRVGADDGTRISLSFKPFGLRFPMKNRISTLQAPPGELVRFSAGVRAEAMGATFRIDEFRSDHPAWRSFQTARPLPKLAAYFPTFESLMKGPEILFQDTKSAGEGHREGH